MPDQSYVDRPWVYVFDASALTNGQGYAGLTIPVLQDSDFVLRKISGARTVSAGTFIYRRNQVSLFSHPISVGAVAGQDWPVVPELIFSAASNIEFDLTNIQKLAIPNGVGNPTLFASQIAFQGVRRFYGQSVTPPKPYRECPFMFSKTFVTSTPGFPPPYNAHAQPIKTITPQTELFDFELRLFAFHIYQTSVGPGSWTSGLTEMELFDQANNSTSSRPVVDSLLGKTLFDSNNLVGNFPVQPLIYGSQSQIRVDVYPKFTNPVTSLWNIQLFFYGVLRIPL